MTDLHVFLVLERDCTPAEMFVRGSFSEDALLDEELREESCTFTGRVAAPSDVPHPSILCYRRDA